MTWKYAVLLKEEKFWAYFDGSLLPLFARSEDDIIP